MEREQVLFRLFGKYCPEGTILATEGVSGEEVFLLQSGAVRVGMPRAGGAAHAMLGPGDLLGEEAFFGPAPRPARAEAVQETRLIQVNDRTLDAVVRHGPETARQLVERLLTLTTEVRGELAVWTAGHLLRRVAPLLVTGPAEPIQPAEIAEGSGAAEVDVRMVLEVLVRRGGLARQGAGYLVADPGALQRVVDGLLRAEPG